MLLDDRLPPWIVSSNKEVEFNKTAILRTEQVEHQVEDALLRRKLSFKFQNSRRINSISFRSPKVARETNSIFAEQVIIRDRIHLRLDNQSEE